MARSKVRDNSSSARSARTGRGWARVTALCAWVNPVSNYEYDALGWRISAVHDADDDGSMSGETTEHYVYDRSWRQVGMFEDAETSATITWVHRNAGLNGQGGSNKIDAVNLRDRDTTDNGTLDERRYYTQNFKGDVVVTMAPIAGTFVWSSV